VNLMGRLLGRERLERELDAELQDHLERRIADEIRGGASPEEARRRAVMALGGVDQVKEACRDARGTRLVENFWSDVRYGLRVLRRSPVFTAVVLVSLALGIGANTAIFTLIDSLILRSLPVRDPGRLVRLEGGSWTNPIWEQVRARQHDLFDGAAAFCGSRLDMASGGEADFAQGLWVSGGFFDVLGVRPVLGRVLSPADDVRGGGPGDPAAVISYAFWQRRFGGAADVVGRHLALKGVPFTIVGVTPRGFFGPSVGYSYDVAVPIGMVDSVEGDPNRTRAGGRLEGRSFWWLEILARLRRGQTLAEANQALRGVQPQIREATLPDGWRPQDLERYLRDGPLTLAPAANGVSEMRGRYMGALFTVMSVVVLVLLTACANLASLFLARATARRRELGTRLALGASRLRLAFQLLTESMLLALPGALLGLALAQWGSRLLVAQIGGERLGPASLDVSLHWHVLLFTLVTAVATALLFGIAPALRAGRIPPQGAMQQQGRTLAGEGPEALGSPLVVAQVAISLVLLFGAGLFLRTFSRLATRDLGVDPDGILLVNVDAQRSRVPPEGRAALFARMVEAAAAVPGVSRAAASFLNPLSGQGWNGRFQVEGGTVTLDDRRRLAWVNAVTPGWLATYGVPLLAGRDFDAGDRAGGAQVALVNEAFAGRFLGGHSPLGRVLLRQGRPDRQEPPLEVVGLVKDAVYRSPRDPMEPTVYLPLAQVNPDDMWPVATLGVKSRLGSPASVSKDVTTALSRVDPSLSLTFRPLSDQVDAAVGSERLVAGLSGFFGMLALVLSAVGLYGVTSYAVTRRRTEIGVRMALGADAPSVVRLLLGRVGRLLVAGVAIGTALSLGAGRFVRGMLFGLGPDDPATLLAAALVLVLVGLAAAGLPARRAARMDPAEALREG
jgi:putative ABC transport system permease protein